MKIILSSKTREHFPGISYTVILIKNIDNSRKISNLSQLIRGQAVVAKNELKKADKRDLFDRVTMPELEDGSMFLESYLLATKVKKIQNGKDIEGKNNLINFVNLISLKYFLPVHGFDLDQAEHDYLLTLYSPKKGKKAPELDFIPQTKNLVIWFPNLAGLQYEEQDHLVGQIDITLSKYLHNQITEVYHLDADHPEIDLGYTSEKETEYKARQAELPEVAEEQAQALSEPSILSNIPSSESEEAPITELSENAVVENIEPIIGKPDAFEAVESTSVTDTPKEETLTIEPENIEADKPVSVIESKPSPETNTQEATPAPINTSKIHTAHTQLINILSEAVFLLYGEKLKEQGKFARELIEIDYPRDAAHGDFASNIAMKLTKIVGENPKVIAEKIIAQVSAPELLEAIEFANPGFINFRLKLSYFADQLDLIIKNKEAYGRSDIGLNEQVMIEYGSLNMAKPFGAHHFLTTIIGQTLVNLHKVVGYHVISADFPGDWGTQFGKSLYALKHWGEREIIEKDPMNELLKLYVRFHEESEKDKTLEDAARAEFKKLEEGDIENLQLWKWIIEVSQRDVDTIYRTVGVKHDVHFPESSYNQSAAQLLEKGKQQGVFQTGEKGAFVVNFENEKLPTAVIQKADGTSLYITRDLASIKERLNKYPELTKIVYVVDVAQSLHFQQLFATAQQLHKADSSFPVTEFKHVVYGRMSFADASMSTRKGNIILATDLIKEALSRAETLVKEKSAALSPAEQKQIAHGMALGAIKYAMICQSPESDFTFDWDRVLSFEGNSAPYLQYTQARANSILRKAAEPSTATPAEDQISLFSIEEVKHEQQQENAEAELQAFSTSHELALLKTLALFPAKVATAAQLYKPNVLTTYLHDLAQTFNSFYGAVPVLKTKNPDLLASRLKLVEATAQILKNGLNLIGITSFERM